MKAVYNGLLFSRRFDFGVPLEDISPPDDLHPRIKLLFSNALQAWQKNNETTGWILENEPSSLEERLSLKDKLILDTVFDWDYPAETYFWALRHFLGLLPVVLLPKYANNVDFDWENLARECKDLFKNFKNYKPMFCGILDKSIAEAIRMLPFQHHLFLTYFMSFLSEVSRRKSTTRRYHKGSVLALAKYFCSAIFSRPYRPGFVNKRDPYQFLLIYLILRWKNISQHFDIVQAYRSTILEKSPFNTENHNIFQKGGDVIFPEKWNKTAQADKFIYNPTVITVVKDFPIILDKYKVFLMEAGCQTESDFSVKGEEMFESCIESKRFFKEEPYKLTYFDTNTILEQPSEEDLEQSDNVFQSAADFSCNSLLLDENWETIRNETLKTVKKVDEYIYDDYETFKREEFNQILKQNKKSISSFEGARKITKKPSKSNFTVAEIHQSTPRSSPEIEEDREITYECLENTDINEINNLTFDVEKDNAGSDIKGNGEFGDDPESNKNNLAFEKEKTRDTSYFKFPGVFDEDPDALNIIDDKNELYDKQTKSQYFEEKCEYFENFVKNMLDKCRKISSKENCGLEALETGEPLKKSEKKSKPSFEDIAKHIPLKDRIDELEMQSEHDWNAPKKCASKRKYVLNRIRLSLEFLRTITPKKSDFRWLEKKVKYQRFKGRKSRANSI